MVPILLELDQNRKHVLKTLYTCFKGSTFKKSVRDALRCRWGWREGGGAELASNGSQDFVNLRNSKFLEKIARTFVVHLGNRKML
jgi:hypothetical protein